MLSVNQLLFTGAGGRPDVPANLPRLQRNESASSTVRKTLKLYHEKLLKIYRNEGNCLP